MNWSTPHALRSQVEAWWYKGRILAALAGDQPIFPCQLKLKAPTSGEISEQFDAVRRWAQALQTMPHVRLVFREFRHRLFGVNRLPDEAWLDSADQALALIGKRQEASLFGQLLTSTASSHPELLPWFSKRPWRALEHAAIWPQLLSIVSWLKTQPRPGLYLRQIDLPGIDSKFIEAHRGVLSELFDLSLPPSQIDPQASGLAGFNRRYGFRDKPERIRCRFLDPACAPWPAFGQADLTLDSSTFAALHPAVDRVFITENEINFLAFPAVDRSLLIFGAGYGFSALAQATWLHDHSIHYWGDLDSHGFAILDNLRSHFPQVQSLLMDSATLFAHEAAWGSENSPAQQPLLRLNDAEQRVCDLLREQRPGQAIRLEQERIPLTWLQAALPGSAR
ncbi:MAG: DUF3322 domain-containing protein [Dechloromonas sp.]|nr:DUF3322 domain-containing protein [Dechloromonas sp.]